MALGRVIFAVKKQLVIDVVYLPNTEAATLVTKYPLFHAISPLQLQEYNPA